MLVCSPFSRGGFVCSDTFDHTSVLRFLETRFGVEVPNLTSWRRAVVGDLTAALNLAAVDTSLPTLPATSLNDPRVIGSDCPTSAPADFIDQGLPVVQTYPVPQPNSPPAQEAGSAKAPSGPLTCAPGTPVSTGPPSLLLAGAAAAVAGFAAFSRRRARLTREAARAGHPGDSCDDAGR
jgi:phospholipase C